jgi:hypothetical protein
MSNLSDIVASSNILTTDNTKTVTNKTIDASQLTGTYPALNGSNITDLTSGNLTGALPAINGSNLTGILDSASVSAIIIADVDNPFIDALNVDADTLDGINSTSFLRSNTSDNFTSGTLEFADNTMLAFGTSSDTIIEHDTVLAPDGTRFYANTTTGGMLFQDGSTTCFDVAYTAADTTTFFQNVDFSSATVTGLSTGGGSGSGISGGVFLEYEKTVDSDYTIDSDGNGRGIFVLSAADDSDGLTIATGATVTVNSGSSWLLSGGDKNMGLDAMVATSNQTERTMRTGTIKPTLNDTYDLGDSAVQYRHVYTDEITIGKDIHQGFVLTSGQSGDQDPLNAWANYATQLSGDGAGEINRGGDITNTSGIFSYPVTGLYKIEFFASFAGGSTDATVQFDIKTTQNNSVYNSLIQVKDHTYGSSYKGNVAMTALHKVTDTTNDKFKFASSSFSGHTTEGSTTEALTYFFVSRLGNAS